MKNCPQTDKCNVLEHGHQVWTKFKKLLTFDISMLNDYRLPSWYVDNISYFRMQKYDIKKLKKYAIMHDCGKPYCLEYIDGKKHFTNHACKSEEIFIQYFGDSYIARLIRHDMDMHTLKQDELNSWLVDNRDIFDILLLSALSEIHANADMFGGIESESFKIKFKNLERRGKKLFASVV